MSASELLFSVGGSTVRGITGRFLRAIATVFLAFLFSAALLRFSPGWNTDAIDMDARLSAATAESMREERAEKRGLIRFYFRFLSDLASGRSMNSELFGQPVSELIPDRAAITASSVAVGLGWGWMLALLLAVVTSRDRTGLSTAGAASVSGTLLSIPSALLALACLLLELPPAAAIAAVVFPRAFPHAHEQLRLQFRAHHTVMARARGISGLRLLRWHIVPGAVPPLAALAGASVPLAFGASIPIEALADSPGLGQLAWRAALGRDMPLLVALTLLLTTVSVTANLLADVVAPGGRGRAT